jgi:hypothetical protein
LLLRLLHLQWRFQLLLICRLLQQLQQQRESVHLWIFTIGRLLLLLLIP